LVDWKVQKDVDPGTRGTWWNHVSPQWATRVVTFLVNH